MKKYSKYILKGLGIFVGILILIYIIAYIYVVANRKEIVEQARQKISKELAGDVKIGNVDINFLSNFPQMSIVLENVSITDTMFAQHHHPFFQAGKVYARISIVRLIEKKDPLNGIRVDNGQLYLYTDTSGYTNAYLLTGKKKIADTVRSKNESVIKKIVLRNVRLILDNKQRQKLYDFQVNTMDCDINTTDSTLFFKTKNNILIHNLAFNLKKGSFAVETLVEGNLNVLFNKKRQRLSFDNLVVDLKGHPFGFSGFFNLGGREKLLS